MAQYLLSHSIKQAYNRNCDINYSYAISELVRNKNLETELKGFIELLVDMNEQCYCMKYRENCQNIAQFYDLKAITKNTNTFQALKFAQCVRYNIEIITIKEMRDLSKLETKALLKLDAWINDMQCAIINDLDEYKNAHWSI